MLHISEIASKLASSPTLALDAQAKQLKAAGEPVIHLGGGEPAGAMPDDAAKAALEKIKSGLVKYTPVSGTWAMKKAVVTHTARVYGKEITADGVLVCGGAKQAIYNFLVSVLNPGDEVVFPAPYWVSYPDMVKLCGGTPVVVKAPDGGFEPKIEDMSAAITGKTRVVMLNSPNNPSGTVYSNDFIGELVSICENRGVYLMMDDIYRELAFGDSSPVSAFAYSRDNSNLVVINGISKSYGMTGFRIGWAVANPALIKVMAKVQGQTTSCPSDLSQAAAVGAIEGNQEFITNLNHSLKHKRDVLMAELKLINGLKVNVPQGTFYSLPDFRFTGKGSEELSKFLLEKAKVVTIPGVHSGVEGHLRISYCGPENDIIEGARRIRWALDPQSPAEIVIGAEKHTRTW